jgi:hypothetical protein
VPFGVAVDEFQQIVYERPDLTPQERTAVWHELEKKYMPWRDYGDDNAFFEMGGWWYHKLHIFHYPFYYINYTLTTMGALEFKKKMATDKASCWQDYKKLCEKFGYELVVADFSEIDLETVLKRNAGREQYKQVPKDVIVKMYESMKQTNLDGYKVIPYNDVMEYLYSTDNPIDVNDYKKVVVFGDIHS